MSQGVLIYNTVEVSKAIKDITKLLLEYQRLVSKDIDNVSIVDRMISSTRDQVATKKRELQISIQNAKKMKDESEVARRLLMEYERKIATCDEHLHELNRYSQEISALNTLSRSVSKTLEDEVNNHRILQMKITALLEQIEASF